MGKFIKEIQKTIRYTRMVFNETWKAINEQTGVMKYVLGLLAISTILLCLMVISILLVFPDSIETLIQDFSSEVRIDLLKLLAGLLVVCLIFPFLFLHQAAKINNAKENEIKKLKKQSKDFNPDVLIDPIPPKHGVKVSSLLVRNDEKKKTLYNCFFRLSVPELEKRHGVVYSKNVFWADGKEVKDLAPNVNEYLNLLEIGKTHFRFLFVGDISIGDDETDYLPYLPKEQHTWLSDKNTIIILTLTGFDKDGNQFQIEKEYALLLFINTLTQSSSVKIREIMSDDDKPGIFQWENDSQFKKRS